MNTKQWVVLLLCAGLSASVWAQNPVRKVSAKDSYEVSDNDNITLREAKLRAIEKAKTKALKEAFGEVVSSEGIHSDIDSDGQQLGSFSWENISTTAKGVWLADTEEPKIEVMYVGGKLFFFAEVHGEAREITQSQTEVKWKVMSHGRGGREATTTFKSGDPIYLDFRTPSDGFVAVYLVEGNGTVSCLLPYHNNSAGRIKVKGGQHYLFFDDSVDPSATNYNLTTKHKEEINQLVLIYSSNPFTKCVDYSVDSKHPNTVMNNDFQSWLSRMQRADQDMVIKKEWLKIRNTNL